MAIRYVRAAGLSVMTVLALLAFGLAFLYWRLNSGPVEVNFLSLRIETAMNNQLTGTTTKIGRTVLELDPETGVPTIRFINISLLDETGATIARAPKAGLELDLSDWLSGRIKPRSFDLYGAKINAVRTFDDGFEFGIANAQPDAAPNAADANDQTDINFEADAEQSQGGKSDLNSAPEAPTGDLTAGKRLMAYLNNVNVNSPLAALQEVRIRRAQIRFVDESNDASWYAPEADVVLNRTEDGFRMRAVASIASSGTPWRARLNASYSTKTKRMTVDGDVEDVIPVDVANKVFALSQFARFKSPLAGKVSFEIDELGTVRTGKAELTAGHGAIDLPNYLAKPIVVDGGTFKFDYDRASSTINMTDSAIIVGGARAALTGSFEPQFGPDGRTRSIQIKIDSDNRAANSEQGAPNLIERVSFVGRAAVEEQRLDIDDLIVMNGQTGVRLRGIISGGEVSTGMQLAGRLRDVSADLLKRLWPPILTPNTRNWVQQNVIDGRITEGTFQINLPPDALARAMKEKRFEPGSITLSFKMADVKSRYFKTLNPIVNASGYAELKEDNFNLTLEKGQVEFENEVVNIVHGEFVALSTLADEPPGKVNFDLSGSTGGLKAFLAHPELAALNIDATKFPQLVGKVAAKVGMEFPLIKAVPKERVAFNAAVKVSDASIPNVAPGIDLTEATFDIALDADKVTASGPARISGIPAEIQWQRNRKNGDVSMVVKTTLDSKLQTKLGIVQGGMLKGDIPVKVTAAGNLADGATIEADLSKVAMNIEALAWQREPTKGTAMTLSYKATPKGKVLDEIRVNGPGLLISGNVALGTDNKLRVLNLTDVSLGDDYAFSARIEPGTDTTRITMKGNTFDLRPYIKAIISPVSGGDKSKAGVTAGSYSINAQFNRVYANRGEILEGFEAKLVTGKSAVQSASIQGRFLSGLPISMQLTPAVGGRALRVTSTDGGAALRAANFYGKIAGGDLEFEALMANEPGSPIRNGKLKLRNFQVRNEAALAELDKRGKPKKSGPRQGGITFKRLDLPFTSDGQFVRLCQVILRGPDIGATASGIIRKSDGAIDITGTYIPAYALNSFIGGFPILGTLLTGGNKEGILGVTYAMGGTISKPRFQVNPLSFLAPGILRKLFEYEQNACGGRSVQQQTQRQKQRNTGGPY